MKEKPMSAGSNARLWIGGAGRIVCLLAVFLSCPGLAHAVDRFDVFLGYDTYVPEASWFPVVCEIENKGPLFSGAVTVSGGSFSDSTERRVPIELPTGTTKRVTIPVFHGGGHGRGWSVHLVNSKGRVVAKQVNLNPRQRVSHESVLLGSISRNDVWSPPLAKIQVTQGGVGPVAARILPQIFPDNPIVLSGLDALYLNSERITALREAQLSAIERWLRTGGHLIVGVEMVSDVNSSPWLRGLVPVRLSGVTTVQAHPELQDWIRSSLAYERVYGGTRTGVDTGISEPTLDRPFADHADDLEFETADLQVAVAERVRGRVLVSTGDGPWIVQGPHGWGRVTVLMFSPEREPFRSWDSLPALWSRLVEVPPAWYLSSDYKNVGGWASDGIFGAMLDSRQVRKLPVGWLLLLLVAYLVVIGPLDRWWLKRIGKPMLTWITFPLYVVLFSGLIYVIGYKLRAGEREWSELHVVDVFASRSGAEWRGRTYASLYSPVNDTYRMQAPQAVAAFRGETANAWGGGGAAESIEVIRRDERFESEAYVPVWTSQLYVSDWWLDGDVPVRMTLSGTRGDAVCEVENLSDHELSVLRVVWRGRVYELGRLASGDSTRTSLSTQQGTPLAGYLAELGAGRYQSKVQQRGRAFGSTTSGRIDDLPGGCFVTTFLEAGALHRVCCSARDDAGQRAARQRGLAGLG
jgi:hypothetical protein